MKTHLLQAEEKRLKDLVRKQQPLEGFFLTTKEGLIFDTKGVVQPPDRVIAYLRYIPAALFKGRASKEQRRGYFKVYLLEDRAKELKARFPWYLYSSKCLDATIQTVPHERLLQIHDPTKKFQTLVQRGSSELDVLSKCCLELGLAICSGAKISLASLGVSGSILVDLHTSSSDIDLVVYGRDEGGKVYDLMTKLRAQTAMIEELTFYREPELRTLYQFRSLSTPISFEDFVRVEHKKVLQGRYKGYDFYIRLVYKVEEIEERFGDRCYQDCGDVELNARIAEDTERFFTPCRYGIEDVVILPTPGQRLKIEEIVSFRGRFCEAARVGDHVRVLGKLEQVNDRKTGRQWYRVLLGRDQKDFMVIGK